MMHAKLNQKEAWPYPTLLPHSLKVYPIVQLAPEIGPQPPDEWPLQMDGKVAAWREETRAYSNQSNLIYVHIPFCPFLCHFCPLYKVDSPSDRTVDIKEQFVNRLVNEIELYGKSAVIANKTFNAIYFGGGTPTELTPAQLKTILNALERNFNLTQDCEITLEGVARQMLAPDYLAACYENGFNRISFGVQSLNDTVRKRIGRGDQVEDYTQVIELARQLRPNFPINVDMMAGLPEQNFDILSQDIKAIIDWNLNSVDVLYYVMMPGTQLEKLVAKGKRSSPDYGRNLLIMRDFINRTFKNENYSQVTGEVFVRADRDRFVHNSFGGGGNRLNTILALGPSAFGLLEGTVYQNICNLRVYMNHIDSGMFPVQNAKKMNLAEAKRRARLLGLLQLEIPDFLIDDRHFEKLVKEWRQQGFLNRVSSGYTLTDWGALWYNQAQFEILPIQDLISALRLFGSLDSQRQLINTDFDELNSHEKEMLAMFGFNGERSSLRSKLYKAYLNIRRLPFFDNRAIGFTGPVKQ